MDFESLLDSIMNPAEGGPSESVYDDLRNLYRDATDGRSASEAKIETLTGENSNLQQMITDLKSKNYDLLTQIGDSVKDTASDTIDDIGGIADSASATIDDLFSDNDEDGE